MLQYVRPHDIAVAKKKKKDMFLTLIHNRTYHVSR